ncbi:MAG TPA: glycosyltransferase family 87 protein [Candidatus Limnocylindrales bacterium]
MANARSIGEAQLASLTRTLQRPGLRRWYRPLLIGLSVGGAIFGIGSILWGYGLGMWPPHDTSAYWLAGRHIIEGKPVYDGTTSWYLAFLYPPPLAVVLAPLSLLQYDLFSVALVGLQIGALRYVTGSWIAVGLLGWIPGVHYEFVAGNVNCLMAAAMYATLTGRRYSGVALALFGLAKFAPVLVLVKASRRQWIEFVITIVVLLAISLPWLYLWPEWVTKLQIRDPYVGIAPLFIRLPIAAVLLLYRRPWSVAAGAALATPIFYEQSVVLLLPAIRLWWDARKEASGAKDADDADQLAAADGRPAAAGVSSRGRTADAPTS